MPDLPTLRSLLQRVEAATGADRELDGDLFWSLFVVPSGLGKEVGGSRLVNLLGPNGDAWRHWIHVDWPPYTASVDAALALVEKVLPGAWFMMETFGYTEDRRAGAELSAEGIEHTRHEAKTIPLAIVAALLTALIAQDEEAEVVT